MLVDGIHAAGGQNAHAIKSPGRHLLHVCIVEPRQSSSDFAAIFLVSPSFPFASLRAHDFD
jgi:hypothetical protein